MISRREKTRPNPTIWRSSAFSQNQKESRQICPLPYGLILRFLNEKFQLTNREGGGIVDIFINFFKKVKRFNQVGIRSGMQKSSNTAVDSKKKDCTTKSPSHQELGNKVDIYSSSLSNIDQSCDKRNSKKQKGQRKVSSKNKNIKSVSKRNLVSSCTSTTLSTSLVGKKDFVTTTTPRLQELRNKTEFTNLSSNNYCHSCSKTNPKIQKNKEPVSSKKKKINSTNKDNLVSSCLGGGKKEFSLYSWIANQTQQLPNHYKEVILTQ